MNTNLAIFNFDNARKVRTLVREKDQTIWFVAKDVCDFLEISNNRDAILKLDEDEKGVVNTDTLGGNQDMAIISESGLYSLVLTSRKEEAKKFKKWITSEVIPSIRKTGSYSILPQDYASALRALANQYEEKQKILLENTVMKPKAQLYDVMLSAGNNQTMNEVAKVLGIGRNKLFAFLREQKILMKDNNPYQEYLDRDYFEVREFTVTGSSSQPFNTTQTLVTAKGLEYIAKLLKKTNLININETIGA